MEPLDYLQTLPWEVCFDGVISQCSFYCSGDPKKAMAQACHVLKPSGILILSDVCPEGADLEGMAEEAGFRVLSREDQTPQWKQYYIQALWRGEVSPPRSGGRFRYETLLCQKGP